MDHSILNVDHSELECPICFEVPRGVNIFMCSNSHNVCGNCIKNLANQCPTCKLSYHEPPLRNKFVEKMIQNSYNFPCIYVDSGCNFNSSLPVLQIHEQTCHFERILCHFSQCQKSILRQELEDHLKTCHQECQNVDMGCLFSGTAKELNEHHIACGFRIIQCPYKGCNEEIFEIDFHYHLLHNHKDGNEGCEFIGTSEEILKHKVGCEYRMVKCFCNSKLMPFKDMHDHIKSMHKNVRWETASPSGEIIEHLKWTGRKVMLEPVVVEFGQHDFILSFKSIRGGRLAVMVHVLSSSNLALQYKVDIIAVGEGLEVKRTDCPIHPWEKSLGEIAKANECLKLDIGICKDIAQQIKDNEEKKICIKYCIKKL